MENLQFDLQIKIPTNYSAFNENLFKIASDLKDYFDGFYGTEAYITKIYKTESNFVYKFYLELEVFTGKILKYRIWWDFDSKSWLYDFLGYDN